MMKNDLNTLKFDKIPSNTCMEAGAGRLGLVLLTAPLRCVVPQKSIDDLKKATATIRGHVNRYTRNNDVSVTLALRQ
jgi:hypothetical protein